MIHKLNPLHDYAVVMLIANAYSSTCWESGCELVQTKHNLYDAFGC